MPAPVNNRPARGPTRRPPRRPRRPGQRAKTAQQAAWHRDLCEFARQTPTQAALLMLWGAGVARVDYGGGDGTDRFDALEAAYFGPMRALTRALRRLPRRDAMPSVC